MNANRCVLILQYVPNAMYININSCQIGYDRRLCIIITDESRYKQRAMF